jgi:antitoxin component YwqK of YwqJK toxin-antitoxin module
MAKKLPARVVAWFDRMAVLRAVQRSRASVTHSTRPLLITGVGKTHPIRRFAHRRVVEFTELDYDQDLGLYTYGGKPFTGVAVTKTRGGELDDIVHYRRGLAHGVSVVWHANGQIHLYNETSGGVRHGLYIEWAEDGSVRVEGQYRAGRLVPAGRKKPRPKE